MRQPLWIALLCAAGLLVALWLPQSPHARKPLENPAGRPVPPVTPESLAAEVEILRGLRYTRPIQFHRIPAGALEQKVQAAMAATVPPEECRRRLRVAFALGFIRPGMEFDAAACLAGSAMEIPAAYYDPAAAAMWVNAAFSPETRPDLTQRLVFHLALALLLQQPGQRPLPGDNDDALLSSLAVTHADATITAQRHARQFASRTPSGVSVPEPSTYYASPPFLRAALAFPRDAASLFHAPLHEKAPDTGTNVFLNLILKQPPQTTAELLHPETWPADRSPLPVFDRSKIPQLSVITENSLGEFGIRTLCKTQLPAAESESAAAGLLADRYLVFSGDGPGQDHLLWITRWVTAPDAAAFLKAIAATLLNNTGTPLTPAHFPSPEIFRASTPARSFSAVIQPGFTVYVASSPNQDLIPRLLRIP